MSFTLSKALGALHLRSPSTSHPPNTFPRRHRSRPRRYDMQRYDFLELPHPPRPAVREPIRVDDEIIVISDDDDDDVENRRPETRGRRPRSSSIDSSSGNSMRYSPRTGQPRRPNHHHTTKRRKAGDVNPNTLEGENRASLNGVGNDFATVDLPFSANVPHVNSSSNNDVTTRSSLPALPPLNNKSNNDFMLEPTRPAFEGEPAKSAAYGSLSVAPPTEPCPFYYDPKLEVTMYCGYGYERFPVVLGTVKGHKAICEKWEAERKPQHEDDQLYIASLTGGVNPRATEHSKAIEKLEQRCLREVQAIFPGIETKFVLQKFRARFSVYPDIEDDTNPSVTEIISEIAERDSYPLENVTEAPDEVTLPEDGTGISVVYNKDSWDGESYRKEALRILAAEFTHIPTISINRILQEKQSLFDTFVHFHECEATFFDLPKDRRPYHRTKQPRILLEKKYQPGFPEPRDSDFYTNLVNELQAAKQQIARKVHRLMMDKAKEEAEAANLAQHKIEGSLVECQTCFDDEIPINRAITCDGKIGHFFCFSCIARLAESQIGAMKYQMLCMDGSGCQAVLSIEGVGRAVPTKVIDKLAFYEQQAEISAAGIEGLEQCPHCEYRAICDSIEEDSVFLCQNPDCGRNSCRKCGELAHLPKTCEDAKNDRGLSARHVVEEARSEAMIRKCPKCRAKIIKELGCNKMVCSCGGMMCYVCQQDISGSHKDGGYQHFHKPGSKCPLYDAQGIERHDQDADAAEKEAIKRVRAQQGNEDLDDKTLQIETGKRPKEKQKSHIRPPPPAALFDNVLGILPEGLPLPYGIGAGPWDPFQGAPQHFDNVAANAGQRQAAGLPFLLQNQFANIPVNMDVREMPGMVPRGQFEAMQQQVRQTIGAARAARMVQIADRVMDAAYPPPRRRNTEIHRDLRIPDLFPPPRLPQQLPVRNPRIDVPLFGPPRPNLNQNGLPGTNFLPGLPPFLNAQHNAGGWPWGDGDGLEAAHYGPLRPQAMNVAGGPNVVRDAHLRTPEDQAHNANQTPNLLRETVRQIAEPRYRRRSRPEEIPERTRSSAKQRERVIRPKPGSMRHNR